VLLLVAPGAVVAQVPVQVRPGQQLPSPDQARQMLQNQPDLVRQLREKLAQSGLSEDQIRARLRAAGYPESFLNDYLAGADTTLAVRPGRRTLDAVQALGILSPQELDSLQLADSMYAVSDSVRYLLDSLRYRHLDSLRADSLADSLEAVQPSPSRSSAWRPSAGFRPSSSRWTRGRWTRTTSSARATSWSSF
jgi:hypothetical protein